MEGVCKVTIICTGTEGEGETKANQDMAAAHRGRKPAYQRRRQWKSQVMSPKIRTRRKKLRSRQRKKSRTQHALRTARSRYGVRRNTATRHFDRRLRRRVLSRPKTRIPTRSHSRKASRRTPRRVGRPRKEKRRRGVSRRNLRTTLKRTARKKQLRRNLRTTLKKTASKKTAALKKAPKNRQGAPAVPKNRRKSRKNEDGMASTSMPDGTPQENQNKKHSVCFANTGNSRTKETELHLQEDSVDNQPSQQPVVPKKRSRQTATPVQKRQ